MIYLEKRFIQLFQNDDDMMFAYIALRELMECDSSFDSSDPIAYVSSDMLCYRLCKDYDDIYVRILNHGITKMIESGIVSVVKNIKKYAYILNPQNLKR